MMSPDAVVVAVDAAKDDELRLAVAVENRMHGTALDFGHVADAIVEPMTADDAGKKADDPAQSLPECRHLFTLDAGNSLVSKRGGNIIRLLSLFFFSHDDL